MTSSPSRAVRSVQSFDRQVCAAFLYYMAPAATCGKAQHDFLGRRRTPYSQSNTATDPRVVVSSRGPSAGVFLGQLVFWADKGADPEWIWKTQGEMEKETGLTRHHQRKAREELLRAGVIDEDRRGVPRRMFYRVNFEALIQCLPDLEVEIQGDTRGCPTGGVTKDAPLEGFPSVPYQGDDQGDPTIQRVHQREHAGAYADANAAASTVTNATEKEVTLARGAKEPVGDTSHEQLLGSEYDAEEIDNLLSDRKRGLTKLVNDYLDVYLDYGAPR